MGSSSSKTVPQAQPQQPMTSGDPLRDAYDAFISNKNRDMLIRLEAAFKDKRNAFEKEMADLRTKMQSMETSNSNVRRLLQDDVFGQAYKTISTEDFEKMTDDQKKRELDRFLSELQTFFSAMKGGGSKKKKTAAKKTKATKSKKIVRKSKKNAGKQSK